MSTPSELRSFKEELNSLREQLLGFVFEETRMKLQIFQRGLRLNAAVLPPPHKAAARQTTATATADTIAAVAKDKRSKRNTSRSGNDDMKNMPNEKVLNAIKLDKELDTLLGVLTAAANEIRGVKSEGMALQETISSLQASGEEVDQQTQQLRQRQATLHSLKTQIESERKEATERGEQMDERIATLRHNLRNVRRLNDLEFELVERWEANRYTQAGIVCASEERRLQQEIDDLKRNIVDEARIIREVEKFNAKQFEEFRVKIAEWKTKYANEMAKVMAETKEHEKRIMELAKIHERHEQTYAERVAFVCEYLAQKAEEQRIYEQQMHRVECAVRLQAWWRGVMVRRGLGPYKKKIKKGKKGKGKGK